MSTIAEKLQIIADQKAAIKTALEEQGKEPTDALSTYAGLIDGLENPERVEYTVTVDGTKKAYAQLYGQQKVTLTATANDIRQNTSAITGAGYTEGQKDIPAYYSGYGSQVLTAGSEAVISKEEYDYKSIMVTIAPYDTETGGTAVTYASVSDAMYEAKTTTKLADITIDKVNKQVKLGITVSELSVLRYFIVREET